MAGGTPDFNKPTEQEKASAEVSAKAYNELVAGKPLEMAYIKDVLADPAQRTALAQGQVNADVMQKAAGSGVDPTRSLAVQSPVSMAPVLGKAQGNAATDVRLQRLAGTTGIIKMGLGQASNAMTGMEGLAKSSVDRSINDAQADYQTDTAMGNALMSGATTLGYLGLKGMSSPKTPAKPTITTMKA